jgi:cytochrome c biogenesis protein CcdA
MTSTWQGDEDVFRFGTSPFLSAASFYLGIFTALMILGALFSMWRTTGPYLRRQKWSFLVSSMVLLIGIIVSLRTPVALQRTIDSWGSQTPIR